MGTPDIDAPTGVRDTNDEEHERKSEAGTVRYNGEDAEPVGEGSGITETDNDGAGEDVTDEVIDAESTSATMVLTPVAQLIVKIDVDYLAEKIADYWKDGGLGLLEVDDGTYINPREVVTIGRAHLEQENPADKLITPTGAQAAALGKLLGRNG